MNSSPSLTRIAKLSESISGAIAQHHRIAVETGTQRTDETRSYCENMRKALWKIKTVKETEEQPCKDGDIVRHTIRSVFSGARC